MTGEEIKNLIEEKNQEIRDLMTPNYFTLNNFIKEKMEEIQKLQNQCPHEFNANGYCKFCGMKKNG